MNNWINLSNIPTSCKYGKNVYDWSKSIGLTCDFYYKGIYGNLVIKKYDSDTKKLLVCYSNKERWIDTNSFKQALLGKVIGLRDKDFKISIGETFKDENRNITIIDRKFKKDKSGIGRKIYRYKCNICKWEDGWKDESHLLHGIGCSCCSKREVVPYINDVYTTNPEYIKYFKFLEDTHKTTSSSKKEFIMVCPFCGNEQLYTTEKLSSYGFSCKMCGDGISYGEKFMYALLKEFDISFDYQASHKVLEWAKKYKYDFYIKSINTIIEIHGEQHYSDKNNFGVKCNNQKEIDEKKEKLSKENGISNYIVIDCSKSDLQYIKKSIIQSKILNILNICENDIPWNKLDMYTSKSFLFTACEYKNANQELSSVDIAKIMRLSRTTVQKYLEKGRNLGICIYDKEYERKCKSKEKRKLYYSSQSAVS